MVRIILASAVAAVAFAAPAAAQLGDAPRPVQVRFSPPLDKPIHIRYEQTTSTLVNGVQDAALNVESQDELRFTKNAEGYVLRWSSTSIKVNGQGSKAGDQQWADLPIEYQLSPTGQPLRVINWTDYNAQASANWARLEASVNTSATPDANTLAAQRMVKALRAMIEAKSPQALMSQPAMLFGFGGRDLQPGAPKPFQATIASPLDGRPINMTGQARVINNPDGTVSVEVMNTNGQAGAQAVANTGSQVVITQESGLRLRPSDGTPVEAVNRRTAIGGNRAEISMTRMTRTD